MPADITVCEIVSIPAVRAERNLPYWLRIMMEHAIFIENGLPVQRTDLRTEAVQFQMNFRNLLAQSEQMHDWDSEQSCFFLNNVRSNVAAFLAYKRMLIDLALKCQVGGLGGYNFPLLLDHIAREATLFLHILDCMESRAENPFVVALAEETFWLRIMTDHSKFIVSLLDQSERGFILQAGQFSETFDRLLRQAQDYRSMLQADPDAFPAVSRFTDEIIEQTQNIRDFKRAAYELLLKCQILSILPPLLADHVAREAEHFLEILAEIRHQLPQ